MPNSGTSPFTTADRWHMRAALALARRGLGRVAPNPAVGCIIVKDGVIVGRGWTQPGGRPHAETEALRQAGAAARGATAYVTLEPCAHHGQTPPCAEALADAGIARSVVAHGDPDPRVSGGGIEILRKAGIVVAEGLYEAEAAEINEGFFNRVRLGRPLVTLKLATTLDGRIAAKGGDSKWITGPEARRYGHLLRARHDAILTGIGTVLADDPMLDCRLAGLEGQSPIRVVLDSNLRTPADSQLVLTAGRVPLLILTAKDPTAKKRGLRQLEAGIEVIRVDSDADGRIVPGAALAALAERGITRVLAECGGKLAASLLRDDLIDRIAWFRAPSVLGGDALDGLAGLGIKKAADAMRFRRGLVTSLGEDVLETYRRSTY